MKSIRISDRFSTHSPNFSPQITLTEMYLKIFSHFRLGLSPPLIQTEHNQHGMYRKKRTVFLNTCKGTIAKFKRRSFFCSMCVLRSHLAAKTDPELRLRALPFPCVCFILLCSQHFVFRMFFFLISSLIWYREFFFCSVYPVAFCLVLSIEHKKLHYSLLFHGFM